jgi:DnaK suppressor protein
MEAGEQQRFRVVIQRRLDAIGSELAAVAESTEPVAPDVSIGRLSRLDSMQMQQMALAGRRRLEEERARLHEAVIRIDAGRYGTCALCGEDIDAERLEYQPDAVACMPCMRRRK